MISTSKIKNINVIKKNWIDKGNCGDDIWSNPHSNGFIFSRSFNIFNDKNLLINKIIKGIIIKIIRLDKIIIII